jgi:Ca2+-binding RTX toxin-like protein
MATITGTNSDDTIFGTAGNDIIDAGAGNDNINAGTGADTIDGGAGNDYLVITNYSDTANTSITYTTPSNGTITGGFNNGTTFKNIERVYVATGSGNDIINISATTGSNYISSGAGNDSIVGGSGDDMLVIQNYRDTTNTNINYTTPSNGTITGGSNNGTTFKNIETVNFWTGSGNDNINISAATGNNTQ